MNPKQKTNSATPVAAVPPVVRIGITGGIGSGKSYVCRQLEEAGHRVFYCDDEAKRILRTSPEVKRLLCDLVGPEVYDAQGCLVKPVLAAYLCRGKEYSARVDAIVHPRVADAFTSLVESLTHLVKISTPRESGGEPPLSGPATIAPLPRRLEVADLAALPPGRVLFMECALLFESGFDRLVDRSVLVHVSAGTQLRRLMARDRISEDKACSWMALQLSEEEKLRLADSVIVNE